MSERARELLNAQSHEDDCYVDDGEPCPCFCIESRALRAIDKALDAAGVREVNFQIGQPVRAIIETLDDKWANEWRDWTGYIASLTYCPVHGVNYAVSDEWPPKMHSDGFAHHQLAALSHDGGGE